MLRDLPQCLAFASDRAPATFPAEMKKALALLMNIWYNRSNATNQVKNTYLNTNLWNL